MRATVRKCAMGASWCLRNPSSAANTTSSGIGGKRGGRQGIGPGNGGPGRLFNTRGFEEIVRNKIEDLFPGGAFALECAFVADPEKVEADLLTAYFESHCELPPANHNRGIAGAGSPS